MIRLYFSPISLQGRRYTGRDGLSLAAAKIQATWRMYRERVQYLEYRQKKWAAGVIAISWIMNVKMSRVRQQLQATRSDQLENFRRRAKVGTDNIDACLAMFIPPFYKRWFTHPDFPGVQIFTKNWDRLQNSRRVIIHIPSLGYSQKIRETVRNFNLLQNLQMARLCDVKGNFLDVNTLCFKSTKIKTAVTQGRLFQILTWM